jgi:hypothetical protein
MAKEKRGMADVHDELVCARTGNTGAVVALVHGGAGPEVTWSRQPSLRAVLAGARHAVPQASGFNDRLLGFIAMAERTRPSDAAAVEPCER